jgi:hypothetical protein
MHSKLFKKGLVIGIIILFVGLAFIPSFNAVSISKNDDTTPPTINLYYEYSPYGPDDWELFFTAECNDTESGMDRVEFSIDDVIMEIDYSVPYEYICLWSQLKGHKYFTATAYDKAGNSVWDGFWLGARNLDIKSTEDCDCQSNFKTHLAEKLINRLEKNEVSSNVIDLNNFDDDRPLCDLLEYILYTFGEKAAYCLEKLEETKGTIWNYYYFYLFVAYGSIIYFYGVLWAVICYEEPYWP